jgi:DNA-binding MarR family transcriptional regulator
MMLHRIPNRFSRAPLAPSSPPKSSSVAIDLAPLDGLIGFNIHILDLLMYQLYYERLGRTAMTPAMFAALAAIKANPGVRQGVLADALLIQRPNMTSLINRLIRAGFVRRRAARGDNRGIELFIRAEGRKALRGIAAKLAAHERSLTDILTATERDRLGLYLTKIVQTLRAIPRANGTAAAKAAPRSKAAL